MSCLYSDIVTLLVYSLTAVVVARPAAALSGAPGNAREARRADSRYSVRKRGKLSSFESTFHLASEQCSSVTIVCQVAFALAISMAEKTLSNRDLNSQHAFGG